MVLYCVAVCHGVTYGVSILFLQWVMERGGSVRREKNRKEIQNNFLNQLVSYGIPEIDMSFSKKQDLKKLFLRITQDSTTQAERISYKSSRPRRTVQSPTSFPLELPPTLLIDKAGSHCTEEDGRCKETDGGHNASYHRSCQSTILHYLRRRKIVCKDRSQKH